MRFVFMRFIVKRTGKKKKEINKRRKQEEKTKRKERENRKDLFQLKTIMKRKRKRRILSSCDLRVVNVGVCIMRFCECGCVN